LPATLAHSWTRTSLLTSRGVDIFGIFWNYRSVSARIEENRVRCETKTLDNVFVTISVSVQQQVMPESARDALYKLTSPASQIDAYVANVIRGAVPKLTLDQVFVQKDEIADTVSEGLSKKMAEFGYVIHSVLLTDVRPCPPKTGPWRGCPPNTGLSFARRTAFDHTKADGPACDLSHGRYCDVAARRSTRRPTSRRR
jgi:hypothetical protein